MSEEDQKKLNDLITILKSYEPSGTVNWDKIGEEISQNFDSLFEHQKQALFHSLNLIVHAKDRLATTRDFLKNTDASATQKNEE